MPRRRIDSHVCFQRIPVSSSWMQMAEGMMSTLPLVLTKAPGRYAMVPRQSQPSDRSFFEEETRQS